MNFTHYVFTGQYLRNNSEQDEILFLALH